MVSAGEKNQSQIEEWFELVGASGSLSTQGKSGTNQCNGSLVKISSRQKNIHTHTRTYRREEEPATAAEEADGGDAVVFGFFTGFQENG